MPNDTTFISLVSNNIALVPYFESMTGEIFILLRHEKLLSFIGEEEFLPDSKRSSGPLGNQRFQRISTPLLFSGKIEENESPRQCAKREFYEEIRGEFPEFSDPFDLMDFNPHGYVYRTKLSMAKTYLFSLDMSDIIHHSLQGGADTSQIFKCEDGSSVKFYDWKDAIELPTAPLVEVILQRRVRQEIEGIGK